MHSTLLAIILATGLAVPLTLTWRPPDGGPAVAGYYIYQREGTQQWPIRYDAGTNLTLTVTNLTAGVTYRFHATAYNQHGLESDPSNEFVWEALGRPSVPVQIRFGL